MPSVSKPSSHCPELPIPKPVSLLTKLAVEQIESEADNNFSNLDNDPPYVPESSTEPHLITQPELILWKIYFQFCVKKVVTTETLP